MADKFLSEIKSETSRTLIRPLSSNNDLSLIECTLKTGRLHQIRATLNSLGFPMLGDKLYGLDDTMYLRLPGDQLTTVDRQLLRIRRQALHSYYISFTHPTSDKRIVLKTDLPSDLKGLI